MDLKDAGIRAWKFGTENPGLKVQQQANVHFLQEVGAFVRSFSW